MSERFDCCVVGAGAMGTATAYQLARRGRSVLLLEQFAIGHENGSSHGNSRIFRFSYEERVYVAMARAAKPMWLELESECGQKLFTPTGGLDLGDPSNPVFRNCIEAMRAEKVEYEVLNAKQIRDRFPQFIIEDSIMGTYQQDSAVLNAADCVAAMAKLASRHGATVRENSAVIKITPHQDFVEVATADEVFQARSVVINAGVWANAILADLGLQLPFQVRKEQYLFFEVRHPDLFQPGKMPVFLEYGRGDSDIIGMYGFPMLEMNAVKVASHQRGPYIDLPNRTFNLETDSAREVEEYVQERFGTEFGAVVDFKTCLYTNTPDQHFVIDKLPNHSNIILSSPCSGHGFKFAILIGKFAADLVTNGTSEHSNSLFDISRLLKRA